MVEKGPRLASSWFCVLSFLTDTYDDKVPLRSTHASLSANNGNRCRGKRPPATPQAAITFEEELEHLKAKHGHAQQEPNHAGPAKPPANQVLPWLPPPASAVTTEDTKAAGEAAEATEANEQLAKQDTCCFRTVCSRGIQGLKDVSWQDKTLEDFEQDAFNQLQSGKKQGKKDQAKPKSKTIQKRPAAAMKRPAAAPAMRQEHKEAKTAKPVETFGCIRCRGNTKGCSKCIDPNFVGLRLPGRQAWRDYIEAKKLADAQKRAKN